MLLTKLSHVIRKFGSQVREVHKESSRSPQWGHVRDTFLKSNDECAACGSKNHLQVHHMHPFHLHPEMELDPANLITLCMDTNECHLLIGHGDSFKAYNPNVQEDAAKFRIASSDERKLLVEKAKSQRLVL